MTGLSPIRLDIMAFLLQSQLKHYDWGIAGALSQALGREPSDKPEAEIWWGNHPLAECDIHALDGAQDFPTWLEKTRTAFPLLVKLLAAEKPLSIQVHPSEEQARLGFHREQVNGISLGARERTYKDPFAKPELIIALSDKFVALAGFASETAVRDRLARWLNAGAPPSVVEWVARVAGEPRKAAHLILEQDSDGTGVLRDLELWLETVRPLDVDDVTSQELGLLQQVSSAHPGDSGTLFALLMHHVYLTRGGALFVPAGDVHAYIEGIGLEVMLPSDNVIRAGLTSKHTDAEGFLEMGNFSPTAEPNLISSRGDSLHRTYEGFGAGFAVHCLVSGSEGFDVAIPSVCLVESGQAHVRGPEHMVLQRGDVVFALPGTTMSPGEDGAVVWVVHPK